MFIKLKRSSTICFSAALLLIALTVPRSSAQTPSPSPSSEPSATPSSSPSPSSSASPAPSPSPSETAEPKIVRIVNPSTSIDPLPKISDRNDGVDETYDVIASLDPSVQNPVLEAYFFPEIPGDLGVEVVVGVLEKVEGSDHLWQVSWDIPDALADGEGILRVSAFSLAASGLEEVAHDELSVEINHLDPPAPLPPDASETVSVAWPEQSGHVGFYRPAVGAWRTVVEGTTSFISTGAAQVYAQAYYTTDPLEGEAKFTPCGSMLVTPNNPPDGVGKPFALTCTLAVRHLPLDVTAIAVSAEGRIDATATRFIGATDIHRVTPYLQDPTQMTIAPASQLARGVAGVCQTFTGIVKDQIGRPVQGANIDFHAQGPVDQIRIFVTGGRLPDAGNHPTETIEACPRNTVLPTTQELTEETPSPSLVAPQQANHRVPSGPDIKHMETNMGSGIGARTTPPGQIRFSVYSPMGGFTKITAWVDDEDLQDQAVTRAKDSDTPDPGEPRVEFTAQWYPEAPHVSIDPLGTTAQMGECTLYTVKARAKAQPLTNYNVDVHATGPDDELDFCHLPGTTPHRSPDKDPPATQPPHQHEGDESFHSTSNGPDPQHIEGETDDAGNLVFGLRSPVAGDTTVVAWLDGEPGLDNDVQQGEAQTTSTTSWVSSPAEAEVSFINPSAFGAAGTQLPDSGGTVRIVARADHPDPQGIEILLSTDGKKTFKSLGEATRIGGSDTFELTWRVNLPDGGPFVLRAALMGTEIVEDINVTIGAGSTPGSDTPYETTKLTALTAGDRVPFRGQNVAMKGSASAGAEAVDFFYTKVSAKDTPVANQWIYCGYADLNGAGTGSQPFAGTCALAGSDQAHQVTGLAAIAYDCTQSGCDPNPSPSPLPTTLPPPAVNPPPVRSNGQRDSGDAVRVFGYEVDPEFDIAPMESAAERGSCERFVVALEDQTGQPIPDQAVDLHLEGPDASAAFCDPADASVWSTSADPSHIEASTPSNGTLVFGVTSASAGDSLLKAWLDSNDNDILEPEESNAPMVAHWFIPPVCTIVGTAGTDVLMGTDGDDRICGRGGNDVIKAGLGNDIVKGGGGRDRLVGGAGQDSLLGGNGRDRLDGGTETDTCRGGRNRDQAIACESTASAVNKRPPTGAV